MNRRQLFAFLPALPFIPAALAKATAYQEPCNLVYGANRVLVKLDSYWPLDLSAPDLGKTLLKAAGNFHSRETILPAKLADEVRMLAVGTGRHTTIKFTPSASAYFINHEDLARQLSCLNGKFKC